MRHATADDLQPLEAVLQTLRTVPGLVERSPGRFYRRGAAFLHFHADGALLFSDLKQQGEWVRYPLRTRRDAQKLLAAARRNAS